MLDAFSCKNSCSPLVYHDSMTRTSPWTLIKGKVSSEVDERTSSLHDGDVSGDLLNWSCFHVLEGWMVLGLLKPMSFVLQTQWMRFIFTSWAGRKMNKFSLSFSSSCCFSSAASYYTHSSSIVLLPSCGVNLHKPVFQNASALPFWWLAAFQRRAPRCVSGGSRKQVALTPVCWSALRLYVGRPQT